MPPQPKTPQATPLTDAARVLGKISAYAPGLRVEEFVPASFARQLETLCHALAGALGVAEAALETCVEHIRMDGQFHYFEYEFDDKLVAKAKEQIATQTATYRTLTSADERRGG